MDNDETIRLILETMGVENVDEMAKGLQKLKTELLDTKGAGYELKTETYELVKGLDAEGQANYDVATSMQEMAKRMRERAEATDMARRALEEDQKAVEKTTGSFAGLAGGMFKAERAAQALTTGTGLARLGPMLESIIGGAGGAAGIGMGLAGLAFLLESIVPKVRKFFASFTDDQMKQAVAAMGALASEAERLRNMTTTGQGETKARVEGYLKELPASVVEQGIKAALESEQRAKIAPNIGEDQVQQILAMTAAARAAETTRIFGGLATDPSARARAIGMAQAHPGNFPRGFAGDMGGLEPGAFERSERAADQELIDAESFGERAHNAGVRRRENAKQAREDQAAKGKRVVHAQKVEDESIIQEADQEDRAKDEKVKADNQAAAFARQHDDAEKRQAQHDAAKGARENTPEKRKERAIAAEIGRQGGDTADPDFVRQVAHQASQNVTAGADIAAAVHMAVQQTEAKIQADFLRAMARGQQQSYSRIDP
jgi:hypothetical protein